MAMLEGCLEYTAIFNLSVTVVDLLLRNGEKCQFCHQDMGVPQKEWQREYTYSNICVFCSSAFEDGTFCHKYHEDNDGWRNCDECGKKVHCGCIMGFHLYESNDTYGVTCKECLGEKTPVSSNLGASSSVASVEDWSQLDSCHCPEDTYGLELLASSAIWGIGNASTSASEDPAIDAPALGDAPAPELQTEEAHSRS